jgi:DNA-binding transcriptional LysR family regulator
MNLHQLSLDDFALFDRVAALGSLSAVARERDAPVSQISRALSRMEGACGVRLLHRSTHGLSLTPEGETLREHAQHLLHSADTLQDELAASRRQVRGLVRVAVSPVLAQYQLIASLPGLAQQHPQLHIDLRVSDALVDMVHEGIDIAIRTGVISDTLVARQLAVHRRRLYAAPDYLKRQGTPKTPQDLAQHRLISNSLATSLNHWPFLVGGQVQHHDAQGHYRADSTNMTTSMVLAGLGIGRINDLVAEPLVRQGRLRRVLERFIDAEPVPVYAVMLPERHRAPRVRACIDYWVQWFGTIDA